MTGEVGGKKRNAYRKVEKEVGVTLSEIGS